MHYSFVKLFGVNMSETTCVATTYDQLESKSHFAIGLMASIRRRIQHTKLHLLVIVLLAICDELLKRIVIQLTPESFERLTPEDQQKTVILLRNLVAKLDQTRDQIFAHKQKIPFGCNRTLHSIHEHGEQLGDILESFELAMNAEFHKLVDGS